MWFGLVVWSRDHLDGYVVKLGNLFPSNKSDQSIKQVVKTIKIHKNGQRDILVPNPDPTLTIKKHARLKSFFWNWINGKFKSDNSIIAPHSSSTWTFQPSLFCGFTKNGQNSLILTQFRGPTGTNRSKIFKILFVRSEISKFFSVLVRSKIS